MAYRSSSCSLVFFFFSLPGEWTLVLFSLLRMSLHRHSEALKQLSAQRIEKTAVFLWIADHTRIEDVLGTVAEPGHGQCCASAVHAGPEQRWASLVCRCGNSGKTRQFETKLFGKREGYWGSWSEHISHQISLLSSACNGKCFNYLINICWFSANFAR